jgi:alpha-tubulin suppressor-like RCC1 family protein
MNMRRLNEGFALPSVVIAAVVMFAILVAAVGTVSSATTALDSQFFEGVVADAAESGAAHAASCLRDNNQVAKWSNASPLRPNTSCSGGGGCTSGANCYVIQTSQYRATYVVGDVTAGREGVNTVSITGIVERVRTSDNTKVWQTLKKTTKLKTGGVIPTTQVIFGYSGIDGAFFATIGSDGIMRAAGFNDQGQLGNGTTNSTLVPAKFLAPTASPMVKGYSSFLSVGYVLFGIDDTGIAYGAGRNDFGQVGSGTISPTVTTPKKVVLPAGKTVKSIATLGITSYFLTTDNNIYAAGACRFGLLGSNYTISGCADRATPVRVALPTPNAADPNTIPADDTQGPFAADRYTVYVRMKGGAVYGWGTNDQGQLGSTSLSDGNASKPVRIGSFGDAGQPKAKQIGYDGESFYVLTDEGNLSTLGNNTYGNQGTRTSNWYRARNGNVNYCLDNNGVNGDNLVLWPCYDGPNQKFELRADGSLYNAAKNKCVDIRGSDGKSLILYPCSGASNQKFVRFTTPYGGNLQNPATGKCIEAATEASSVQLLMANTCLGWNQQSFLPFNAGLTPFNQSQTGKIDKFTVDQLTVAVLNFNGEVWGAGENLSGVLGNGTTSTAVYEPVKFDTASTGSLAKMKDIYITQAGIFPEYRFMNLLAIGEDSRVYGAGANSFGQLGLGYNSDKETRPKIMQVIDGTSVKAAQVQIGLGTTVIYTTAGSVYTVGNNSDGQLADGLKQNRNVPIRARYVNDLRSIVY